MTPELAQHLLISAACAELLAALLAFAVAAFLHSRCTELEKRLDAQHFVITGLTARVRDLESSVDYRQVRQVVDEAIATARGYREIARELREDFTAYRLAHEGNGSNPMGRT